MNNDNLKNFIKENADFKPEKSQAEFEQLSSYIKRRNSFTNPFIPFLVSSSLVLALVLSVYMYQKESPLGVNENNIAEEYLFESYFLVEDALQDEDKEIEYIIL